MSKTIKVPDIGQYPITLEINGARYSLTPGATVTVPDAVAELLATIAASKPQPDPDAADCLPATVGYVKAAVAAGGGSGSGLPEVDSGDNGKVLGVDSGKWAAVAAPTGLPAVTGDDDGKVLGVSSGAWAVVTPPAGGSVVTVPMTITSDAQGHPAGSTTADFAAVYAASKGGATVVCDASMALSADAAVHLIGVMSRMDGDGTTYDDQLTACIVMGMGQDFGLYQVVWDATGVYVRAATLTIES